MQPFEFVVKNGKENTDGSCLILAIAAATGCDYSVAYAAGVELGFKPRKGTPFCGKMSGEVIARHTGTRITNYNEAIDATKGAESSFWMLNNDGPKTLKSLLKVLNTGRFIVTVKGHAFAVVNGCVIDNGYFLPTDHAVAKYGRRAIISIAKILPAKSQKTGPAVQLTLW